MPQKLESMEQRNEEQTTPSTQFRTAIQMVRIGDIDVSDHSGSDNEIKMNNVLHQHPSEDSDCDEEYCYLTGDIEKDSCANKTSFSNVTFAISTFYKEHCIFFFPMLGWFLFSGLLSLYNKYVFGEKYMAFPCPLLMTAAQFLIQFLFSFCLTKSFPITLGGDQIDAMDWTAYLAIAIPCGAVTSFDIGLSNLALVRITMSFYTMVKSSAPIFVVISAFIFGIEEISQALVLTVLVISVGELLTVFGEVEFDTLGFFFALSASVLSGMRWTIVQLKIQSLKPSLKSSVATMRLLSPVMFLSILIISFLHEKPWEKLDGKYFESRNDIIETIAIGIVGAMLAICMILCEFYLIMKSSAIVLMIGGVLKELVTIFVGVFIMKDKLNFINSIGCIIVFMGVLLYKRSIYIKKLEIDGDESLASTESVSSRQSTSPLISNGYTDSHGDEDEIDNFNHKDKEITTLLDLPK